MTRLALATEDVACVHCGADLGEDGVPAHDGYIWVIAQCHALWLRSGRLRISPTWRTEL